MEEMLRQMICNGHWKIDINQAFSSNIDFQNLPNLVLTPKSWFKIFAFKVYQNLTLFYAFCKV